MLFGSLPRELSPLEDRGRIWVRATAPNGVSYDYMQDFMDRLAAATAKLVPEAHMMMTQVPGSGSSDAVNNGFIRIFLKEREARERSQQDIVEDLRILQRHFTEARVNITQEASIGARRSKSRMTSVIEPSELSG